MYRATRYIIFQICSLNILINRRCKKYVHDSLPLPHNFPQTVNYFLPSFLLANTILQGFHCLLFFVLCLMSNYVLNVSNRLGLGRNHQSAYDGKWAQDKIVIIMIILLFCKLYSKGYFCIHCCWFLLTLPMPCTLLDH